MEWFGIKSYIAQLNFSWWLCFWLLRSTLLCAMSCQHCSNIVVTSEEAIKLKGLLDNSNVSFNEF